MRPFRPEQFVRHVLRAGTTGPGPYLDHIALWAIRINDLEARTTP